MTYRHLPEHLHQTADLVQRFMRKELGLSKIQIEVAIDDQIEYRPTLSGKIPGHHIHCAEVSESIITSLIDPVVLQCQRHHFPALLYVAFPSKKEYPESIKDLKKAKELGVGVLEVDHAKGRVTCINNPLSLSLTGLRLIEKGSFPRKYRASLSAAEDAFLNGNPSKGCSMVYDEIELLTRKIAYKTYKLGYWNRVIKNPEKMKEKMVWTMVLTELHNNLNRSLSSRNGKNLDDLSNALLSRIIGVTPYRNQSGHKPSSLRTLRERDAQLRTRMEAAVDLLEATINASKCLRV